MALCIQAYPLGGKNFVPAAAQPKSGNHDIGAGEVFALAQQRYLMLLRAGISEAIAQI